MFDRFEVRVGGICDLTGAVAGWSDDLGWFKLERMQGGGVEVDCFVEGMACIFQ